MDCRNHPGTPAVARCAGCAEAFCTNCLVDMGGQPYCGSCKVMAMRGSPIVDVATIPCKEATTALVLSIIGLVVCGIILEPLALSKAAQAKKMIAANPRMTGLGKANAATVIAIIGLILWAIFTFARLATLGHR
jgi:hypothetical protein